MEGGPGPGSWVFIAPLSHPYSGWWSPDTWCRPTRSKAASRTDWGQSGSWDRTFLGECELGSGLSQVPLYSGTALAEGGCREVRTLTSIPSEDYS